MGSAARPRPLRLAEKLLRIREALELSQNELIERLGMQDYLAQNSISNFERDFREPPLPVLLGYARLANVIVDVLIDDDLELPPQLPSRKRHEGVKRSN
jgi:transcriptional regulator with XRE-family HTH domain